MVLTEALIWKNSCAPSKTIPAHTVKRMAYAALVFPPIKFVPMLMKERRKRNDTGRALFVM